MGVGVHPAEMKIKKHPHKINIKQINPIIVVRNNIVTNITYLRRMHNFFKNKILLNPIFRKTTKYCRI